MFETAHATRHVAGAAEKKVKKNKRGKMTKKIEEMDSCHNLR